MLGCQDFCGYYDWTFHHVRQHFGQPAVAKLWAEAIGGESQSHYRQAAQKAGLRGLYDTWNHTGDDEACVWSLAVDEAANFLRIDMRECPSKGFLQQHNLNHDEDYCDHCIGWTGPLLSELGIEVTRHEHNHCGQCWWEMRAANEPQPDYESPHDIRHDARWNHGYLDRFARHQKLPLLKEVSQSVDSVQLTRRWFDAKHSPSVIVTDRTYLSTPVQPDGVLIDRASCDLSALAQRFNASAPADRPLLMNCYLPADTPIDFVAASLPRPVPILPLLLRAGAYVHQPHAPSPPIEHFLELLVQTLRALDKNT